MEKKTISNKVKDITEEATGAVVSAGIGMAVGGPVGAVIGASVGTVIKEVYEDLLSRFLSKKERERVVLVTDIIKEKLDENIKAGKAIRDDDFFTTSKGRSSAEEIYEGVLIASQKEYEEKKLILLGRLYANIACDKSVNRQISNATI